MFCTQTVMGPSSPRTWTARTTTVWIARSRHSTVNMMPENVWSSWSVVCMLWSSSVS